MKIAHNTFMIELTSKQHKALEKLAHDLNPVALIGGAGVEEAQIKNIDEALKHHELIKIKFNEFKEEKAELTQTIAEKCDATLIRIIGNTAILYRQAEKEEDVRIKL